MFSLRLIRMLMLPVLMYFSWSWAAPLPYGDPTSPAPGYENGTETAALETEEDEALAEAEKPKPRWQLTSTLVAGERRVAVINGRSVALGARIEGARLVAVEHRSAVIDHAGRQIRLNLPPSAGDAVSAKMPTGR